jgi:hypothetical protein
MNRRRERIEKESTIMEALVHILGAVAQVAFDFLVDLAINGKKKKQEDSSPHNYLATPEA